MTTQPPQLLRIPLIIHLVNHTALLAVGVILLLAGVVSLKNTVLLLPVLGLMLVYGRFRSSPNVAAAYFGLSMSVLVWIVLCENIVRLENLTGLKITDKLHLGSRLMAYVDTHLTRQDRNYSHPCCHDPLTRSYQPGSIYQATYDCPTCNPPHRVVVDETGFLNRSLGLMTTRPQIDLFIAGDSVLQGLGVPSVVEFLRDQMPITMWNLSIAGYGPRQKISALLAKALDKHPKWLIVEFYARNDVSDVIGSDVCDETQDYWCAHSNIEIFHRLRHHPTYRHLIHDSDHLFQTLAYYASQNFTLAVTRYVINALRASIKHSVMAGPPWIVSAEKARETQQSPSDDHGKNHGQLYKTHEVVFLTLPAHTHSNREEGLNWVTVGMTHVHEEYARLVATLAGMAHPPTVILLYNPTPYELYRDIRVPRHPDYDLVAEFQREAQRTFATKHDWVFLDLTGPLQQAIREHTVWLYGRVDPSHWSPDGTELAARVLSAELLRVMGKGQTPTLVPPAAK